MKWTIAFIALMNIETILNFTLSLSWDIINNNKDEKKVPNNYVLGLNYLFYITVLSTIAIIIILKSYSLLLIPYTLIKIYWFKYSVNIELKVEKHYEILLVWGKMDKYVYVILILVCLILV